MRLVRRQLLVLRVIALDQLSSLVEPSSQSARLSGDAHSTPEDRFSLLSVPSC